MGESLPRTRTISLPRSRTLAAFRVDNDACISAAARAGSIAAVDTVTYEQRHDAAQSPSCLSKDDLHTNVLDAEELMETTSLGDEDLLQRTVSDVGPYVLHNLDLIRTSSAPAPPLTDASVCDILFKVCSQHGRRARTRCGPRRVLPERSGRGSCTRPCAQTVAMEKITSSFLSRTRSSRV